MHLMHVMLDTQTLANLGAVLTLIFTAWKAASAAQAGKAAMTQGVKNGEKAETIHILVNSKMSEQIAKVSALEAELVIVRSLVASLQAQLASTDKLRTPGVPYA